MPSLDFFAARTDLAALLMFLLENTDVRVFESYSDYGQPLKEFRSFGELADAYEVGVDKCGRGDHILLQLWSPAVMDRLEIERIELNPQACEGQTFRYRIQGWGLIQLYLGGVYDRFITKSHFGHNSEKRAQAWGHADGVNWEALTQLSNKVQYHIRSRLAVARVPGRPVLREAYALAQSGYELTECARSSHRYDLPLPSPPRKRTTASG
jgi:hypothetical protein